MSKAQTDNSDLGDKIALRLSMLPNKKTLKVVDAYAGRGTIWKNVQKRYPGKIKITKIDKEQKETDVFMFLGDNTKFLLSLPLHKYDVIDLDAYGVPYEQLKIVFNSKFKGIVFVTFIQSFMGRINCDFLQDLGYTKAMIDKCPSLFCKDGLRKLERWLILHGIARITIRHHSRKSYLGFEMK